MSQKSCVQEVVLWGKKRKEKEALYDLQLEQEQEVEKKLPREKREQKVNKYQGRVELCGDPKLLED